MAVDLHTHSLASDGTDAPGDVVRAAADAGLTWMSLTDHDTLAGAAEATSAAAEHGVGFIPGIELSVSWDRGELHLLVYFVEPGPGPLQDRLDDLRDGRRHRAHQTVDRLNDLGFEIDYADVERAASGESIGRPHVADALVAAGYFSDRDGAFAELLRDGGPAHIRRQLLGATEAIGLARRSGGVAVLAHPYTAGVGRDEYAAAFRSLVEAGLGGIEVHHPEQGPDLRGHLAEIADQLGIVATGGSDYHGAGKPGVAVGTGKGDLFVPDDTVDRLRGRLE